MACATGSQRKPGSFRFIHVDPAYMESILPVPLVWLRPFLPYVAPFDVDTNALCALGPPDWPALDALQLFAILTGEPHAEAAAAAAGVAQIAANVIWQLSCQCTPPEVTPPLNPAPGAPTDTPVINPPTVVAPPGSTTVCVSTYPPAYTNPSVMGTTAVDIAQLTYGANAVQTVRALLNHQIAGAAHPQMTGELHWFPNPTGGTTDASKFIVPSGQFSSFTFPVLAGSTSVHIVVFQPTIGTDLIGGALEGNCAPGGSVGCCAGSDPRLLALLTQTSNLLSSVQRSYAPFASIPGTQHASLTGDGSFAVSRLIGLRIDVVSHTPTRPDLEGNPPYVWDQGWVSVIDGDGLIEEKRVSQTHLNWMPRLMTLAVTVGYSFRPGTVVTITELKPEP